jgi:uncharacterized membrane protein YgcG
MIRYKICLSRPDYSIKLTLLKAINDIKSVLGKRFVCKYIVAIFLVTISLIGSGTYVLGQNTTITNAVNETVVDDYDYYGQPIYYTEDDDDDTDDDSDSSSGGNNYYYTHNGGNAYYKDENGNAYYKDDNNNSYHTDVQGHHYWYDNDGHKYYYVDDNHNQKFHYDDNGNKVTHDNRGDSMTVYDSHSSGTHAHYSLFSNGNHVQNGGSGSFVHHNGVNHEYSGSGFSPQGGFSSHGGGGGEFRGHGR